MSPDWSCTVLVHNRTSFRKYRILLVLINLCNSLISAHKACHSPLKSTISTFSVLQYATKASLRVANMTHSFNRIYRKKNIIKMAQVKMPYSSREINAPNYTNDLQHKCVKKRIYFEFNFKNTLFTNKNIFEMKTLK